MKLSPQRIQLYLPIIRPSESRSDSRVTRVRWSHGMGYARCFHLPRKAVASFFVIELFPPSSHLPFYSETHDLERKEFKIDRPEIQSSAWSTLLSGIANQ